MRTKLNKRNESQEKQRAAAAAAAFTKMHAWTSLLFESLNDLKTLEQYVVFSFAFSGEDNTNDSSELFLSSGNLHYSEHSHTIRDGKL